MLSFDPTQALLPPGGKLYPLGFFDPATDLDSLVAQALQSRPEVNARAAEVAESSIRLRQEKLRPWLPTVGVGFSAGSFGGGSDLTGSSYGGFGGRTDFDVFAVWTVQNLGVGNRALQNRGRARVGQAVARLDSAQNRIREEVVESSAQIRSARSRIETARRQLATAQEGFAEEMARIKQGEGRPLEVLDSARQLTESRQELIRAIAGHNVAQFRLLAAVGTPPDSVAPTNR
jgi:outer membrane protein TolC